MQERLDLAVTLDAAGAERVAGALETIQGVSAVTAAAADRHVHVSFDADRTSVQELEAVLLKNGYPVQRRKAGGGCCGGCGG
ncbi:copper chaperone [Oxalobacteraceae bacterium OM1]|nr:copper chaperone [Oxalobacteraceae bacterium OM1]